MMRLKTLLLLGISLILVSCGGQKTATTPEASPTTEASPTAAASPTTEASPTTAASPGVTKVIAIPVALFAVIDANKDGSVTLDEYVEYYTTKAEPKLSKEEATKNFEALNPKDGKVSKDAAK